MTSYLHLFFAFFRIGLFTIGGGLAALPLIQNYSQRYGWVDEQMLAQMVAISEVTPGPIGINMATYVGWSQMGVFGSIVATAGIVTPSLFIIYILAKSLKHVEEHWITQGMLQGIRPAVIGIIAVTWVLFGEAIFGQFRLSGETVKSGGLFLIFLFMTIKIKAHPIVYIVGAAVVGIVLY